MTSAATATKAKKFNIFINDTKYTVENATMTGAELKALANIAGANQLFLDNPGHQDDTPVADGAGIELKSGQKFYDVPIGNLG